MSDSRTKRRRPASRAYRPALDGKLEDRVLLSKQTLHQYLGTNLGLLKHPQAGVAFHLNKPPFALNAPRWNRHFRVIHAAAVQTIRGGQAANVVSVDGSHFRIQLGYESNTVATAAGDGAGGTYTQSTPTPASGIIQPTEFPQPIGTLRVYAMPNGEVGIIVDGSNANTELTINPLPTPIRKGYAHSYAYGQSGVTHILNIGQITVNSGSIAAIEGFHTANLVGPLVVGGTTTVDRIAFNSIGPGASITTGGSLNTLDVLQGITLNTGTNSNITIGRDLNLLNVGGNIDLENGSFIKIDRHLGAVLQPPKGTGTGSNVLSINLPATTTLVATPPEAPVSGYIQGNVTIGATSSFVVGGEIFYPLFIIGNVTGIFTIGSVKSTAEPPLLIQGTPNPSQTFPAITSLSSTTFTVGSPGTFTVTTTGFPITSPPMLTETGALPTGVTSVTFVDNHDGTATLAGTPPTGTAGTYPLTITATNSVGQSATQSFTLNVAAAAAGPTVTHLSPNSGPAAGGTSVTINGTNLAGATVVDFGTTPATFTVFTDNLIMATSPAGTAGPVDVTVTTPSGTSATSTNDKFMYT
ncbi:MAG: IPT/TIG domain-containing protein [Isosphaeraceae bacterium]